MNEQNFSTASRLTHRAVALAAEKTAVLRVPSGRFAWPFPVARLQEAHGGGRRVINSAGTETDSFVT